MNLAHLTILLTEIGDATHGGRLALGEVLVDLIDALGDVIVCLVE